MSATARQERAFNLYLKEGPDRSLMALFNTIKADPAGVGFKRAPSLRSLEAWSSKYGWQARIVEIQRKEREANEQEHLEWVRQHRERLRQEGLLLQQKGIAWLKDKDPAGVSAAEAVRAIEAGFRLEALALGEVTERVEVDHDERLRQLTSEELELVIRYSRHPQE